MTPRNEIQGLQTMKNGNEIALVINDLVRAAKGNEYSHAKAADARRNNDDADFANQMKLAGWYREDMKAAESKLAGFGINLEMAS